MMATTHATTGVTAGAGLAAAVVYLGATPSVAVAVIPAVAVGALLPDLDHPHSLATRSFGPVTMLICWLIRGAPTRVGAGGHLIGDEPERLLPWEIRHRGATHTWQGAAAFGFVTAAGTWWLPGPAGDAWWLWGVAVALGCLTHMWGDARTTAGLWVGHGHDRRWISIGAPFQTGSDYERWLRRVVYVPCAAVACVAALWLIGVTS